MVELSAFVCLMSLIGSGLTCAPTMMMNAREPKDESPLTYKQHIPNTHEFAENASGPPRQRIYYDPKDGSPFKRKLIKVDSPDIVWKNEELKRLKEGDAENEDHYMTPRCEQKLIFLKILLENFAGWQVDGFEVKLRVVEAWDQQGNHAPDSLHYEGRALDVTTSDRDRRKYGMLARLAVQAGFDYVSYESRGHVHVSCRADDGDALEDQQSYLKCFHGDTKVTLRSGSERPMKDIRIGDEVLAVDRDTQQTIFSPVIMFLDREPNGGGDFIAVKTERMPEALHLTPFHLIYRFNQSAPVFAKDLKMDDFVRAAALRNDGDEIVGLQKPEKIISLNRVKLTGGGYMAPLTKAGTIVTNRIVTSCYAVVHDENVAHFAMSPFRWLHSIGFGFDSTEQEDVGVHWYALGLHHMIHLLQKTLPLPITLLPATIPG